MARVVIRVEALRPWAAGPHPRELADLTETLAERFGLAEVELLVTDDAALAALNRERLGLCGPTNTLAFPEAEEGGSHGGPNGGLAAISLQAVAREAFLYGQDPAVHCARLVAHALLHLAGLDHGPDMESATEAAAEAAVASAGRMTAQVFTTSPNGR